MPCATRPAARQRPLPDAEIVGEVVSWTFLFEMQATLHPRRVSESGAFVELFVIVPTGGTSGADYSEQEMRHILIL
jgi:hypothetical protein